MVIAARFLAAIAAAALIAATPTTAHATPKPPAQVEAWAFCGVHPDAPNAWLSVHSLAAAGITATLGPCFPLDWNTYTTAEPGPRYATPATYSRLVEMNASVGMKTVVYDARLWSVDPAVRAAAITFWTPQFDSIAAWDMGDEFDPRYTDWPILVARTQIMMEYIEPATRISSFTNQMGTIPVLDQALADLGSASLAFDDYNVPEAVVLTLQYAPRTPLLTVAIAALDWGSGTPTPELITEAMQMLHQAGADRFLIFGGAFPYSPDLTPDPTFGGYSLVDPDGHATWLAAAVLAGTSSASTLVTAHGQTL